MAATITLDASPDGRATAGGEAIRRGKLNVGVYATNGVAVTKASFDLWVGLIGLYVHPAGGYLFEWDKPNGKVKAYRQNNTTGPLQEVPNATDLSAVEPRFRAEGL